MEQGQKFFISFNAHDSQKADWIAWTLREAGHEVAVHTWELQAGGDIPTWMNAKLAWADRLIAVVSPDYVSAKYSIMEWTAAVWGDPVGESASVIPVVVRPTQNIPPLLAKISRIDLTGIDEEEATRRLVERVKEPAPPHTKPTFEVVQPEIHEQGPINKPPFSVWQVPFHRNPNFTGREEELDELHKNLNVEHSATAIQGLGGIGKTQLAVEYCYRFKDEYAGVLWFRSETPVRLIGDYAALAEELKLGVLSNPDQSDSVTQVQQWLATQESTWLLVYDNAVGPQEIEPHLAGHGPHHRIVTSRQTGGWRGVAASLEIRPLRREESVKILLARHGSDAQVEADHLAEALGDLPLALEQAAAYMDVVGLSPRAYLDRFESRKLDLLANETLQTQHAGVTTTFILAFEQVESGSPAAAQLLKLLSIFSPDLILDTWITEGAGFLPELLAKAVSDEIALDQIVIALRSQSLITALDKQWSLHRLVQQVMQDRLGEEVQEWAGRAVEILRLVFEQNPPDPRGGRANEQYWRPYRGRDAALSHAIAAGQTAEKCDVALESVAYLYREISHFLQFGQGEFESALAFAKRAWGVTQKVSGSTSADFATANHNVCLILQGQQRFDEALEFANRSLEIDEQIFGPVHTAVARDLFVIGQIKGRQGDSAGELKSMRQVLDIHEKVFPENDPAIAFAVKMVANTKALRFSPEELNYLQRALDIDKQTFGPESPNVAEDLFDIGYRRLLQGDRDSGLKEMLRALEIEEAVYGPESLEVAHRNHAIGTALNPQSSDLALKYAQRALDVLGKHDLSPREAPFVTMVTRLVESIKNRQEATPDNPRAK